MKARDSEKGVEATGGGEGWHLLSGLPLGQLAQPLLAGPHAGVDDLEEELAGAGVEDEDGPVDGLGGQVALKGLVDGHTVHVGVIHKPDDLVAEQLTVVLHAHPASQQPKNRLLRIIAQERWCNLEHLLTALHALVKHETTGCSTHL